MRFSDLRDADLKLPSFADHSDTAFPDYLTRLDAAFDNKFRNTIARSCSTSVLGRQPPQSPRCRNSGTTLSRGGGRGKLHLVEQADRLNLGMKGVVRDCHR